MQMNFRKKTVIVFIIIFLIGISSILFSTWGLAKLSQNNSPGLSDCLKDSSCASDVVKQKQLIVEQLKQSGPKKVYSSIKEAYSLELPSRQHDIAHLFGKLLYLNAGINGIGVCDNNFAFGCYHGFFIEAILDKGTGIVNDLDKACIDTFGELGLGCQHGIGHGIMEYYGPLKLNRALELCSRLNWQKPLLGCAGGVFMEYNLPLNDTGKPGLGTPRAFSQSNPYGSCYVVAERFQQECFYNLGLWWNRVLNKDYANMLVLCGKIEDVLFKERCLMGVGNAAATTSSLNIDKTKALCDQISTPANQTLCRAGAAWVFYGDQKTKNQAKLLCDDLQAAKKNTCQKYTNILDLI